MSAKSDDETLSDISMHQLNKDNDFIVPHTSDVNEYSTDRLESIFFRNTPSMPIRSGSMQVNPNGNSPVERLRIRQGSQPILISESEQEQAE